MARQCGQGGWTRVGDDASCIQAFYSVTRVRPLPRIQSANKLRQMSLTTIQIADTQGGTFRSFGDMSRFGERSSNGGWKYVPEPNTTNIYYEIMQVVFGPFPDFPDNPTEEQLTEAMQPIIDLFKSPGDFTLNTEIITAHKRVYCSFAANLQVFQGTLSLNSSISDGLSQTIAFSERYAVCQIQGETEEQVWTGGGPIMGSPPYRHGARRAGFADPGNHDVIPVATRRGKTLASVPGTTFQVRPTVGKADGKQLQTPYSSGLPVAMFDGSVRFLSPSIDEAVFWGAITPAGGEVLGDF